MEDTRYSKNVIVRSDVYSEYRDILNAILDEDTEYTLDEVDVILCGFLEGEVK